jgi:AcrR family transcriptional regulator
MKDIAQAANVTEAVLYRYFASKDDLFDAAVLQPLTEHLTLLYPAGAEAIVEAPEPRDRVQVIAGLVRGWLDALDEMLPLLGLALFSDRARGERFYREHLFPVLAGAIDDAPSTLRDWGRPDVDPEILILSIFWLHLGIAFDQQVRGRTDDPARLERTITDLVTYGVSPRHNRNRQ